MTGKKSKYYYLILGIILLCAFFVRFLGINFGLPYLHYWDEPQAANPALRMLKTGDFNPHVFNWPGLTSYSCFLVDVVHYYYLMKTAESDYPYPNTVLDEIEINEEPVWNWRWSVSHPSFYLWNRFFFCVIGTITVFLTYLIAKEMGGEATGLMAAFLIAGFSRWHILYSRYIAPDILVCFFVLLVVYYAIRYNRSHALKDLLISLLFAGLAISSKYSAILSIHSKLISQL